METPFQMAIPSSDSKVSPKREKPQEYLMVSRVLKQTTARHFFMRTPMIPQTIHRMSLIRSPMLSLHITSFTVRQGSCKRPFHAKHSH
jgi:hypothetical protein